MSVGGSEHHLKPAPKIGESSAPSVVIASDHALLRGALAEALAAEGMTVLDEAEEGQRAISLVTQHKPQGVRGGPGRVGHEAYRLPGEAARALARNPSGSRHEVRLAKAGPASVSND
jgi:hypothetical protein